MSLDHPPKRRTRARPELSVFDEELNVPFDPKEFLPDVPSHARRQITSPAPPLVTEAIHPNVAPSVSVEQAAAPAISTISVEVITPPALTDTEVSPQPRTNPGQTSDKARTEPRTNPGQTSDKARTTVSVASGEHPPSSDKARSQRRTEPRTDLGQTSDKLRTVSGFFELVGLQRQIILFLHDQAKLARDRVTDPIAISVLAESCGTTVLSAQKTIQRLEGKGTLRRVSFRNGRGGWTRYEVAQEVFQEILHLESQDKLRTNLGQTSDELRSQPRTQPRTGGSSSSSSIDISKTTTTSEPELIKSDAVQLSPDWRAVDLNPLAEIGFTETHLIQIVRRNLLRPDALQDSIHAFAFDLRLNGKGRELKSGPLNYFMGILRNGPYAPPENYESPEQAQMRQYLDAKRRAAAEREKLEKELQDLEFSEWVGKLSFEDRLKFAPGAASDGPMQRGVLRCYFEDTIWPDLKGRYLAAQPGAVNVEVST